MAGDGGLQEASAERYGRLRLGNVADVMGGKLDPAEYLRRGRHAEWTEAMTGSSLEPCHRKGCWARDRVCGQYPAVGAFVGCTHPGADFVL